MINIIIIVKTKYVLEFIALIIYLSSLNVNISRIKFHISS